MFSSSDLHGNQIAHYGLGWISRDAVSEYPFSAVDRNEPRWKLLVAQRAGT